MLQNTTKFITYLVVILAILFIVALVLAFKGWGHLGYGGEENEPSMFYSGGAHHVYVGGPSVREGSTGGPNHRGGGIRGGK